MLVSYAGVVLLKNSNSTVNTRYGPWVEAKLCWESREDMCGCTLALWLNCTYKAKLVHSMHISTNPQ